MSNLSRLNEKKQLLERHTELLKTVKDDAFKAKMNYIEAIKLNIEKLNEVIPEGMTEQHQKMIDEFNKQFGTFRMEKSNTGTKYYEVSKILIHDTKNNRYCYDVKLNHIELEPEQEYFSNDSGHGSEEEEEEESPPASDSEDEDEKEEQCENLRIFKIHNTWYYDDMNQDDYYFTRVTPDKTTKLTEEQIKNEEDDNYLDIIYQMYKDKTAFDEEEGVWFFCQEGIWKASNSKVNYYLHREMPNVKKFFKDLYEKKEREILTVEQDIKNSGIEIVEEKIKNAKGKFEKVETFKKYGTIPGFEGKTLITIDPNDEKAVTPAQIKMIKIRNFKKNELSPIEKKIKNFGKTTTFISKLLSDNSLKATFSNNELFKKLGNDRNFFTFLNCCIDLRNYKNPYDETEFIVFPLHSNDCHFTNTKYNLKRQEYLIHGNYTGELLNIYRSLSPSDEHNDFLLSTRACCLSGNRKRNNLIIDYGEGGSQGKSLLQIQCQNTFGEYCKTAPVECFSYKNKNKKVEGDGGEPEPMLYNIKNARMVFISEPSQEANLDEAKLKKWTGGESLMVRTLHQKIPSEISPQCRFIMPTNFIPKFNVSDTAFIDRITLVEWKIRFLENVKEETEFIKKRQSNISDKINDDELKSTYSSAFFFILLSKFNPNYTVQEEWNRYRDLVVEKRNYAKLFYDEVIEKHEEADKKILTQAEVLKEFNEWYSREEFDRTEKPSRDDFLKKFSENFNPEKFNIQKGNKTTTKYKRSVRNYFMDVSIKMLID